MTASFKSGYSSPPDRPPTVRMICPGLGRAFRAKSTADFTFCSRRRVWRFRARCSLDTSTRTENPAL